MLLRKKKEEAKKRMAEDAAREGWVDELATLVYEASSSGWCRRRVSRAVEAGSLALLGSLERCRGLVMLGSLEICRGLEKLGNARSRRRSWHKSSMNETRHCCC